MLSTAKSITLTGKSEINNVLVETFTASINSENPKDVTFSSYIQNKDIYWNHLDDVEADESNFKKYVKKTIDEMIVATD